MVMMSPDMHTQGSADQRLTLKSYFPLTCQPVWGRKSHLEQGDALW